jgi:hypothetical protein
MGRKARAGSIPASGTRYQTYQLVINLPVSTISLRRNSATEWETTGHGAWVSNVGRRD